MTFLNGLLAFGALAFTIPLAIHLLHRSRYRTVDWGAMHLLDAVVQVNRRRLQIQQLILLLIRCAIPILLALCLARPVLTMWRALPGNEPTSLVLLIDDSYSTDRQLGEQTALEMARQQIRSIVAGLPRGSEVMVVATGGRPQPLWDAPVVDLQRADRTLKQISGGAGPMDVAASLEAAAVALAASRNARRELVIVSDFQAADWQSASDDLLRRFRQRWQQHVAPSVTLLPLVKAGATPANVSVDDLQTDSEMLAVDEPLRLRATIRNGSEREFEDLRVHLLVDGQPQSGTSVTLRAGETRPVLMTHAFQQPGSHLLSVAVDADDVLDTDDRRQLAVVALESIDVLLIDGAPSKEPLQGETDYLMVAMSPFAFGRQQLSDLLRARAVAADQWREDTTGTPRAVVLANVQRLHAWQVDWLRRFVRAGGALLIFGGDRIDHRWYNDQLGPGGADLLPMEIGAPQQAEAADPRAAADAAVVAPVAGRRIVGQFFEHPSMQLFNDASAGDLSDGSIQQWHPLRPFQAPSNHNSPTADGARTADGAPAADGATAAAASGPAVVVARLDTGDPLVVERACGDGVTMVVGTAADADHSNLPLRPFYVPLVQEWMTWMITRGATSHNLQVGSTATAHLPADAAERPLQWWTPAGEQQTLMPTQRGERAVVETAATRLRGVYTLRGEAIDPIVYVAQADSRESDLQRISDDSLRHVASLLGAQIRPSADAYVSADRRGRFGREIWRPMLWALLALMGLEMVLQQRFARVRE